MEELKNSSPNLELICEVGPKIRWRIFIYKIFFILLLNLPGGISKFFA